MKKRCKQNGVYHTNEECEIETYELQAPTIISPGVHAGAESCNDRQSALFVVNENSVQTEENVTKTKINSKSYQSKDNSCKDRNSSLDVDHDNAPENGKRAKNATENNKLYTTNKRQHKPKRLVYQKGANNATENIKLYTTKNRQNKRKRLVYQKGIRKKYTRFNDMTELILFLAFFVVGTTYAQNLPIPSIVTSPIVLGEDVTFQCSYYCPKTLELVSMLWLKGQTKNGIIYGNFSTKDKKYTSIIYHEANQYQYFLTIHNVSITDFDKYRCQFDFQDASIAFTLKHNLSFIDFPDINDVVFNVSGSELTIWIQRIYPQPNCTVFYNDDNISHLTKTENIKHNETMYSTVIKIQLSECCGDVNGSCLLNSRTFTLINNVQLCSEGMECLHGKEIYVWMVVVSVLVVILGTVAVVFLCFLWHKRKQTHQQETYTGIPLHERNV